MKKELVILFVLIVAAGVVAAQDSPFGMAGKNIAGSTVTWMSGTYNPGGGTTDTICFSAHNNTDDAEWLDAVVVTFPATWTAACFSQDAQDSGGNDIAFSCTPVANVVTYADTDGGYGEIYSGQTWGFCVDVTPPLGTWTPPQQVDWDISGDDYGADPRDVSGSEDIVPVTLMSFSVE